MILPYPPTTTTTPQAVGAELGHLPEPVYMQLLAAVPAALHPAAAASAAELMDGPEGGQGPLALLAGAQGPLQEETLQGIVQGAHWVGTMSVRGG